MSDVILFDLDGTLTDSGPGIIKCVQYALNYMGKPEGNPDNLRCFVGPPLHEQFMEYSDFTSEEADTAVEQYRERYASIGIYENKIYEKIPELLQLLKEHGKILGVASSKPTVFVEEILLNSNLRKYFDVVVGSELDGTRTSKDEVIEEALKQLGVVTHREQVLMVGDRLYDVEGAKSCGLLCIGAAYGYGGREELEKSGAVFIADTVEELKILAQEDEGESEKIAYHKTHHMQRKKRQKKTQYKHQVPGNRRPSVRPEVVGKMLWEIISPMLIHFGCMLIISLLGVMTAGALSHGTGADYIQVVHKFPWLTSVFSALTAVAVILLLYRYYLLDKERFQIKVIKWNWLEGISCAAAAIGLGLICNKLITASGIREIFLRYMEISENSYENQSWILLVICIGVLASAGEELVFRGLIYLRAKSYFGLGWAVGISSALFGFYHGNTIQFLYTVALGILFAILYEKTGTLLAPITAHIAVNIFSVSYDYIVDFLIKRIRFGEQLLMVFVILAAAAAFYYLFAWKASWNMKGKDPEKKLKND
ncbi:HAD-IA family hydrolase [Novisyntrophococcus fermenticellae]|uniref:HAD-IA family hydrolase n=1 Tax=Novisyntrophococcus fermenticellae TaxID=2068655 RepID=UPI002E77FF36|nr:HAD-IA family hydrolase [Novisyntrophococcus fermenticellae]